MSDHIPIPPSDEELAAESADGSLSAYDELARRYENRIFGFLNHRLAARADAEDVTQQTFIQAYRKIHQFNQKYQFRNWIFTIARNLAVSHYRKQQRLPDTQMEEEPAIEIQTPRDLVAQKERRTGLWNLAKDCLSEKQFYALWLRYAEDMRTKQIAEVMDNTNTNVKVLLHRARKKLAAVFQGQRNDLPAPVDTIP